METISTRNTNAKNIETRIRNAIQMHSGVKLAKVIGVNSSQMTRWQAENGIIE